MPSIDSGRLIQNNDKNFSEKSFSYLKDKIKKFEIPPNNIHENSINRSTTTIRSKEATADVDPVKGVSEDDQRIYDDKNSRFKSLFLINRDESQSKRIPSSERCSAKFVSDGNNNQVKESAAESDTNNSSLTARQLRDTKDINTHCRVNGDDIKVTKVVIRTLAPIVVKKKSQVLPLPPLPPQSVRKQNSLDDNDFSFIDSSSRSVSRSSSTSFASDDLGLFDEKVNQRKARIPKIARINNCNYSREFSVRTSANQNIYSSDQSESYFVRNGWNTTGHQRSYLNNNHLENSENEQHLLRASTNNFSPSNINQSAPERSVSFPTKPSAIHHAMFQPRRR